MEARKRGHKERISGWHEIDFFTLNELLKNLIIVFSNKKCNTC